MIQCSRPDASAVAAAAAAAAAAEAAWSVGSAPLRTAVVRQQLFFPDRRLIQFDCGKLQVPLPPLRPSHLILDHQRMDTLSSEEGSDPKA